jgi:hypothetical protein
MSRIVRQQMESAQAEEKKIQVSFAMLEQSAELEIFRYVGAFLGIDEVTV